MTTTPIPLPNALLRRRALLAAGLIFALWASWKVGDDDTAPKSLSTQTSLRGAKVKTPGPAQTFDLQWPERPQQQETVVDLFAPPPPLPAAAPPSIPAPPVLGLKYMGRLDDGGNSHAYLADAQNRVFTAKAGEDVADGWRLSAIDSKKLMFRHMATGHEQTISTGAIQ